MGFLVLAGLFEPGTVVELFEVTDEATLRVENEQLVGKRLADARGSVGFDGLEVGQRYIARGKDVYGHPVEERARGLAQDEGTELAQEPIRPVPQNVGTQEAPEPKQPAAEPDAILHTGVPAGLPLGVTTS
jgi:hypothetical protein